MGFAGGRALTPARGTLLRVRRSSKLAAAALVATGGGLFAFALDVAGVRVPDALRMALALAALPFALAIGVRTGAGFWRGPALLHFPVELAVQCHGKDADLVRAAASVRGALGGAGHVFRGRLVFPVVAWLAASAVLACTGLGAAHGAVCRAALELLAVAVPARLVLPARPFWYREWQAGSVVLYPPFVLALATIRAERSSEE